MRLIIVACLILMCCISTVSAFTSGMAASGISVSGDLCTGGLLFSWHGEDTNVTVGTPKGCSVGATTGTPNRTPSISTAQFHDGTHSIKIPTTSDRYTFAVSSGDIVKRAAGTITLWLYINATPTANTVFTEVIDSVSGKKIDIGFSGTTELKIRYVGNGTDTQAITSGANLTTGTWYFVTVKWDVASGTKLSINVNGVTATSSAAITQMTNEPTSLIIGDPLSATSIDLYFDQIQIWDSWQ